ncbi:cell division protein ZapA [Fodinisporobacter ferrooxydans]|uniref:Cell division protein ZapA n=1 Tax=Fodinisporobacter ferrooxydans TaxID=2901836 RepID=A0ABY4CQC4_9BACL|nr:cell division protein ZapA [Alicyclobacillaceae bacterium MYW30-H2]
MSQQDLNRIHVDIFGHQYSLRGQASSAHMRLVAALVDEKMKEIAQVNSRFDLGKVAVLSAVNIADEYIRLLEEYKDLLNALQQDIDKTKTKT